MTFLLPLRRPAVRPAAAGLALLLLALASLVAAPAPRSPAPKRAATNQLEELVIICDGGAVATPTNAIWRKNVRAADSHLYLECQELTAQIQTRSGPSPVRGAAAPRAEAGDGGTNRARIEAIIADTDVMVILPELQILGDRAVYTATNDVLRVTGVLVIVSDGRGSTMCTNFTFDRTANVVTVEGPQATVLKQSAFTRTNSPPRAPRGTP